MNRPAILHRLALLLILPAAFVAAAGAQPAPAKPGAAAISVKDSSGKTISLAASARRIVSISPQATEVLYAVGAGAFVVGDTTYCDYPAAATALPKVGGFSASTISVERIVALKPDLVVSAGTMHAQVEAALARLSIPVFAYDPRDFDGIAAGMNALGDLAGTGQAARKASGDMLAAIARVKATLASVPAEKRPTVFWEVYDEPLMTCGADTFPHAIVEAAGGRDIFSDLPGAWPRVSAEEVIRRAPAFIMGADDHGDKLTVAGVSTRPGWASIPAVKDGRVVLISANLVSRAGPRVAEGVYLVAKALYPGLVK